jgi:hypothetical protein
MYFEEKGAQIKTALQFDKSARQRAQATLA